MRVYRVEHRETREGPYRQSRMNAAHQHLYTPGRLSPSYASSNVPAPHVDGIQAFSGRHFGFESIPQASRWFDTADVRLGLHNEGFVLVEYEIDEMYVTFGRKQVAFFRSYAAQVAQHSIPEALHDVQEAQAQDPSIPGAEGPRIPEGQRVRDPGSWYLGPYPWPVLERGGSGEDRADQEGDEPSAERAAQGVAATAQVVERQRSAFDYYSATQWLREPSTITRQAEGRAIER